jgi:predicted alpha/beta-fold hydrolase
MQFAPHLAAVAAVWLAVLWMFATGLLLLRRRRGTTRVVAAQTPLNAALEHRLRADVGSYQPPWWYNAHVATLAALHTEPPPAYERRRFADFAVDWLPRAPHAGAAQSSARRPDTIVLYFPGLGISSDAPVARAFARHVAAAGHFCGVVTPRGRDVPLRPGAQPWHPALEADARAALADLRATYAASGGGRAAIFLAGFSGSTVLLSNLLADSADPVDCCCDAEGNGGEEDAEGDAEEDAPAPVVGAMLCCLVHNYCAAREGMERRSLAGRVYAWLLAFLYRRELDRNADAATAGQVPHWTTARAAQSLGTLDAALAPVRGFASLADMDDAFSLSAEKLARVRVPVALLQPADDPLWAAAFEEGTAGAAELLLPRDGRACPRAMYIEPSHGAHFGFVGGAAPHSYAPRAAVSLFQCILDRRQLRRRRSERRRWVRAQIARRRAEERALRAMFVKRAQRDKRRREEKRQFQVQFLQQLRTGGGGPSENVH